MRGCSPAPPRGGSTHPPLGTPPRAGPGGAVYRPVWAPARSAVRPIPRVRGTAAPPPAWCSRPRFAGGGALPAAGQLAFSFARCRRCFSARRGRPFGPAAPAAPASPAAGTLRRLRLPPGASLRARPPGGGAREVCGFAARGGEYAACAADAALQSGRRAGTSDADKRPGIVASAATSPATLRGSTLNRPRASHAHWFRRRRWQASARTAIGEYADRCGAVAPRFAVLSLRCYRRQLTPGGAWSASGPECLRHCYGPATESHAPGLRLAGVPPPEVRPMVRAGTHASGRKALRFATSDACGGQGTAARGAGVPPAWSHC